MALPLTVQTPSTRLQSDSGQDYDYNSAMHTNSEGNVNDFNSEHQHTDIVNNRPVPRGGMNSQHGLGNSEKGDTGGLTPVEVDSVNVKVRSETDPENNNQTKRVVEVTTKGKPMNAHVYRYYFENRDHGGGYVEKVEVSEDKGIVYVTFRKQEVAENVVQLPHEIGGQLVQLRLCDGDAASSPDFYVDKLLFRNVDVTKEKDHLCLYFKEVTKCEPIEKQTLYGDEPGVVLVTFSEQPDLRETQKRCHERKHLDGREIRVSRVTKPRCIIVENLNPKTTSDGVFHYFHNEHRGGAPVERLEFSPDKERCFVYFKSHEVVKRIVEKEHRLDDYDLRVVRYLECLGPSAGGFDSRDFFIPESCSLEPSDLLVWKFIRESNKVQRDLNRKFEDKHGKLCFENGVTVKCTLNMSVLKVRFLAKTWETDVRKIVSDFLCNIQVLEVGVEAHSWTDVEEDLKSTSFFNRDEAIRVPSKDNGIIYIVGLTKKAEKCRREVSKRVTAVEKENLKRTKVKLDLPKHKLRLLEKSEFNKEVEKEYRKFSMKINMKAQKVEFQGTVVDTKDAQLRMHDCLSTLKSKEIQDLFDIQKSLLDEDKTTQSIENDLKKKKAVAVLEKVETEIVVYALGQKALEDTLMVLHQQLALEVCRLTTESAKLLTRAKFLKLKNTELENNRGSLAIECLPNEKRVNIAGTAAKAVKMRVEAFMVENTIYVEIVRFYKSRQKVISTYCQHELKEIETSLEKHKIRLCFEEQGKAMNVQGTSPGLAQVRLRLQQLNGQLACHPETLTDPDKIKFLYSYKCIKDLDVILSANKCILSLEYEDPNLQVVQSDCPLPPEPEDVPETSPEEVSRREKENSDYDAGSGEKLPADAATSVEGILCVLEADITELDVHVIVNAANGRLEHGAGLARAIVQKGGKIIQEESRKIIKERTEPVREGDVLVTGPGQLPCKEIFHAVGPRFQGGNKGEKERLTLAVKNCLQMANQRSYQSIALPAISTSIFRYPVKEATVVIVEAVKNFLEASPKCSLENVILCDILPQTVEHFQNAMKIVFDTRPTVPQPATNEPAADRSHENRDTAPSSPITVTPDTQTKQRGESSTQLPPLPPRIIREKEPTMLNTTVQNTQLPPPKPPPQVPRPSGTVPVSLIQGEIAKQRVDVIVNSTSTDLSLSNGAISSSILKEAGRALQNECKSKYPRGIKSGEVARTKGYSLRCKEVYHLALRGHSAAAAQSLYLMVTQCLQYANSSGYTSIAFPALGTGNLKYPAAEVAGAIVDAVNHFKSSTRVVSVKEIKLIVYDTDSHRSDPSSLIEPKAPARVISVSILRGEIARQKADVIVNSVSKDLALDTGSVSRSILDQAGQAMQKELRDNHPRPITEGDVLTTSGHGLQCRHVFHVCLPAWSDDSSAQVLHQAILQCLMQANDRDYTSIAFPTLGTGILSYPPNVVAHTLLHAVSQFEQIYPLPSLREVRVVVFTTDDAVFQVFQTVKSNMDGTVTAVSPQANIFGPETAQLARPYVVPDETKAADDHRHNRRFQETPAVKLDSSEMGEIVECEVWGIHVTVKQGKLLAEPAHAVVTYVSGQQTDGNGVDSFGTETLPLDVTAFSGQWEKGFLHCLKQAAKKEFSTVALEPPSSGTAKLSTDMFAEAIFKAVTQFCQHRKRHIVQEMRMIFSDGKDVQTFIQTIQKLGEDSNKTQSTKGNKPKKRKVPFVMHGRNTVVPQKATMYIYATETANTSEFLEAFDRAVKDRFTKEHLEEEQLIQMDRKFIQQIEAVARVNDVKVKLDFHKGLASLSGLKDDVSKAKDAIVKIIRKAEKDKHEEDKKAIYANIAQWCYLQKTKDGGSQLAEYPSDQNKDIEIAYQKKKKRVEFCDDQGTAYVIDLDRMLEYPKGNDSDAVHVLRRDKIRTRDADGAVGQLPRVWATHDKDQLVKLVSLQPDHPDYQTVRANFESSLGRNSSLVVVGVTRIQNVTLYTQYQAKKLHLEKQNVDHDEPNFNNEKTLWHGTARESTDNINTYGFNRSYCGKNATVHGKGVYFAVNSEYSARDAYSPKDADGKRYIYQSKVLVGVSTKSDTSMRFLPVRTGNIPYDSACDSPGQPGIYVIFHDTQAYPEYLITFQ